MSRRARRALVLVAVTAAACLDPLYEDGAPLTSGWVLCCKQGDLDTCYCDDPATCQQALYPCAGGRCSATPGFCPPPPATGGGPGLSDAGAVATGGGEGGGGGGAAGGGGGSITLDAGAMTGGGGGSASPTLAFCCVEARVTTCACPAAGCSPGTFTPCPGGACVAGTTTALCR